MPPTSTPRINWNIPKRLLNELDTLGIIFFRGKGEGFDLDPIIIKLLLLLKLILLFFDVLYFSFFPHIKR